MINLRVIDTYHGSLMDLTTIHINKYNGTLRLKQ